LILCFAIENCPAPNMVCRTCVHVSSFCHRRQKDRCKRQTAGCDAVEISHHRYLCLSSNRATDTQGGAGRSCASIVSPRSPTRSPQRIRPSKPVQDWHLALEKFGHVVLCGADFDSGTAGLGTGGVRAAGHLAAVLKDQPDLRIALVGTRDSGRGATGHITLVEKPRAAVAASG